MSYGKILMTLQLKYLIREWPFPDIQNVNYQQNENVSAFLFVLLFHTQLTC